MKRGALARVTAVTFDFGNTLVPVGRDALRAVVRTTADAVCGQAGLPDVEPFLAAWGEERDRQFREEIPKRREPDLRLRVIRVLARLRGMPPPPPDRPWDDAAASRLAAREEVELAIDTYLQAFVEGMPAAPAAGPTLALLAGRGYRLGIISNWPLASAIERYVDVAGWRPHLAAVVVSERVGTIKPYPAIFSAARAALGDPEPGRILHVGDEWVADVEGAHAAGWLAAHIGGRPADSPLPASTRPAGASPDLDLDRLEDLPPHLPGVPADVEGGQAARGGRTA